MVLLDNCFLWPMAAVHDPRFELLPSVPQHEKPHGWKPILQKWQCYICCWWPFFGGNRMKAASPMGSKHYKSDGRHCWTAKGTKLQNKPHLVPFNVRASWSADKLFCWPSYMAFQWKVLNWWHQQRKPFSSYDCNLLEFRCVQCLNIGNLLFLLNLEQPSSLASPSNLCQHKQWTLNDEGGVNRPSCSPGFRNHIFHQTSSWRPNLRDFQ